MATLPVTFRESMRRESYVRGLVDPSLAIDLSGHFPTTVRITPDMTMLKCLSTLAMSAIGNV